MIAAVYARKSTEQNVADEAKFVVRQVENARAFAAKRGWTVSDAHVYVDDGISGTEFKKRPGLQRLKNAVGSKSPFGALIVSEQKSIGREMSETAMLIKQLAQAGVEIFEYVHGKSLTPTTPTAKLLSSVQGFSDEDHAVKTSERVSEAHAKLFGMGRVVGGRVFGYDNRHIFKGEDASGNPLKSHTERVVNPVEAAVVRRIFELYDAGEGLKRIAMQLNAEGAAAPKPFVRKDPTKVLPVTGWAPSTARTILMRELYHGEIMWNKSRKRDDFRQVNQRPRPESEWLRADAPHLRIVDEPLWKRVQSRRRDAETLAARLAGGRLSGRPPKTATQNLLAGLATCALCGGGLVVETSSRKRGRVPEYICYRHRANGACTNTLRMPVEDMNAAVLQAVEEHALTPEAVEQVIHLSERDDVAELQDRLERERKDVEKRIARLVTVIETGGDAASLVAKLRQLEARRTAIDGEVRDLRPVPRLAPAVIENRLAEWRRLLRSSTTQGRTVLQRILRGRLTFTPRADGRGYDFTGPTRFDKLFTGIAHSLKITGGEELVHGRDWVFCRTGDAAALDAFVNRDALEDDYGRLLDRAYESSVKVLASPRGFATGWKRRFPVSRPDFFALQ